MNTKLAINNLLEMSKALEISANSPKNYNSEYAFYLETMSWEMKKHADQLSELECLMMI